MDWADLISGVSDNLTSVALAKYNNPVMVDPKTGRVVSEGKPTQASVPFGLSPAVMIGGVALVLLVGFFMLRK